MIDTVEHHWSYKTRGGRQASSNKPLKPLIIFIVNPI